jgi:hypothetical protein
MTNRIQLKSKKCESADCLKGHRDSAMYGRIEIEMTLKKSTADLSNAKRAEAVFKPPVKPLTGDELERQAFDDNRQRLKALRLARDAETGQ